MFEHVLQKGQIGGVTLKNRFVMPAMSSSHGEANGTAGPDLIAYYAARARGGFGLIITEFTYVSPEGCAIPGQLRIDSDDCITGYRALTERVHAEGGTIFMQIHHAGRETVSQITGLPNVAPSAVPCPVNLQIPHELTLEEVWAVIEKYGDAALRAKKAGFDGVEIHGAHGYLAAQFASSYANKRMDEFGGDIQGKCKFPVELVRNVKKKCGADFPVIYRISGEEHVEDGRQIGETVIIAKALEEAGVDAIHVSAGVYASMPYIIAPSHVPFGYNLYAARAVKAAVHIPVIGVGRITDPSVAEDAVSSGAADFVSLGRASIADPEFPIKVLEGRTDEISPCVGCLSRCQGYPGVDPNDHGVSCMINPLSGHENRLPVVKSDAKKCITVVGGGPGGLEFAWLAASRGHQVTLFEKTDKLGGQLVPGCVPPAKQELTRAIRFYTTMCKKYGVDIRLNAEADADRVAATHPDAVVLATGGVEIQPQIENEGLPVAQAVDVLRGRVFVGKRVLVVGGGLVGVEMAEHLLNQNRRATIVEMLDTVAGGMHPSTLFFLMPNLQKGGVEILKNTRVERFTRDGAVCVTPTGEITLSGYDMAILAMGVKSYNPLEAAFKEKFESVYVIGDAVKPRRIVEAVEEGARLALRI